MKKILLIFALIVSGIFKTYSQVIATPITIEQYRQLAVDSSKTLRVSNENTNYALSNFKTVRTGYYPSLRATATGNYFLGNPMGSTMEVKDYAFNTALTIQQNIYAGNSVKSNTDAAAIKVSIADLNYIFALEKTIYNADLAYWALVWSIKKVETIGNYVVIVLRLKEVVKERFDDGYVSRTDLLMVETRLNEALLQQIAALQASKNYQQALNTLLGNIKPQNFVPTDTLRFPKSKPHFFELEYALKNRADYQSALESVKLAKQNIKVIRSNYNPTLVGGISGVYGTINPNRTGENNLYGYAYLNFSTPIFHFGERRHAVRGARSNVKISELNAQYSADQILGTLNSAKISINQLFEQVLLAEQNLKIANQNLELNTFSYNEGKLPILDVLSAQLSWFQSYNSAIDAMYQYQVALTDYNYAIGELGSM